MSHQEIQSVRQAVSDLVAPFKIRLEALSCNSHFKNSDLELIHTNACLMSEQERHHEALNLYIFLVGFSPANLTYLKGLAHQYYKLKRYKDAIPIYKIIDIFEPVNPENTISIAQCYLNIGQITRASLLIELTVEFCQITGLYKNIANKAIAMKELINQGEISNDRKR